ncbi:efflux transporter outer membrane subunit [Cocleimonas sp. KMM 6892]|uniref:efflux transporter outer membrane subunit n=1 Tax=unclassified Cocleimonas TaxID=2639732 RepID=UPI002DBB77C9|nr:MULTISPECIES: efflux transporter outer membrane subunit [unclassified Cocleimonas]MEB8431075.1 efflux transporter outer membrane subunit [Cocleimonas sp. KMM 6892]MEC4714153.1 efflux transporter outer membrane subunit [Cocleimonas sp. KMM 6895]MEC4743484.1 efflux transporter outer membrane subunit [Cocleimonas sp. KMM 6896]
MNLRKSTSMIAVIITILSLSACSSERLLNANNKNTASGSSVHTPEQKRSPVLSTWWQKFNDPLMTSLIEEALQANPDIKTAQASLRSARAQTVIARSSLLPTLSASGSAGRVSSEQSYGAGLDASWELDFFGSNRFASNAAEANLKASQASLEDVKTSLAAEVASAYVNLRLAQAQLEVSKQSLASRAETSHLITLKQQSGLASGLEEEQAKLSLGQVKAEIPALENSIISSQHALALLLGKEPEAIKSRLTSIKPIPSANLKLATKIPANTIRQRPDVRAAEYLVTAAELHVGEAKANLYPSFNLTGSLDYSSSKLSDLFDPSNIARSLLASISAPLFNGGSLKQQVVVQDAEREQAVATYQKTLLTALQDVANAFASLQSLAKQTPILQNNIKLARNTERLSNLSYNAGTDDFQNVLEAQRTVLTSQQSLLTAQAEQSLSLISLYKAVGGTW